MKVFSTYIESIVSEKYTNASERFMIRFIAEYVDKNSDILSSSSIDKLVFSEVEQSKMFNLFNINPKDMKKQIKLSGYIDAKWVIGANPFNLLCASVVRHILITKPKNYEKLALMVTQYLALKLYPSRFYASFPHGIIPNVMSYTINNLSYKFLIKIHGTLLGAMQQTCDAMLKNHSERLENGDDKSLVDFVNDTHTRLGHFIKGIADEYYKNYENKNYLNSEEDKVTDDSIQQADSNLFMIQRSSDKVMSYVATNGVNVKLIAISAKMSDCPDLPLINAINTIFDIKAKDIKEFVSKIITVYVTNVPSATERELGSSKFFAETIKIYKKNNTNDKNIIDIKNIIHEWLMECSDRYRITNREATLNNFRRAIYIYFVLMIQTYVQK